MWAVIPLVFWSLLVMAGALDDGKNKQGLQFRVERSGIRVPGRLISVDEDEDGRLRFELGVRKAEDAYAIGPDGKPLDELPADLVIEFREDAQRRREAPRINLQDGQNKPIEVSRDRLSVLLTRKYIVRVSGRGLQIQRKEKGFNKGNFVRELMKKREQMKGRREGPIRQMPGGPGRRSGDRMQDGQKMQDRPGGQPGPGRRGGNGQDEKEKSPPPPPMGENR